MGLRLMWLINRKIRFLKISNSFSNNEIKHMRSLTIAFFIFFIAPMHSGFCQPQPVASSNSTQKRKSGDPLKNLPKNIEVLTLFGERADISPDNNRVAFMAKTFGDAMVIDLKTRQIWCLTCHIPAAAFLRVMHLSNGDYLLIGPDHFENILVSRKDADVWYLSKEPNSRPVKIGLKVNEGIAVSKKNMKIAFTQLLPDTTQKVSQLVVTDLDITGSTPKLINQKTVLENTDKVCTLEAQDFYDNDAKMTFFCYVPNGAFEVKGIHLQNNEVTNFSKAPGSFNEPEGIFPDGRSTTVESDRQCEWLGGQRGSANLDIWKLGLDGTGKNFVRLTHFNDYEGGKASNPVVATNGTFMAFQAAKSTDPPGIGHGLLLYWFENKKQK